MNHSEAGRLGALKTNALWKRRYRDNPKHCQECNSLLSYKKRHNKFCDQSCAAHYNNRVLPERQKRPPTTLCLGCNSFTYNPKYCNNVCQRSHDWIISKAKIEQEGIASSTRVYKKYLSETGIYKCKICGISDWMNSRLGLILDHKDGNSDNWKTSNLRLLCPNCDSQTDTYKSRNMGKGRHYRRQRYAEGKSY